MYCQSLRKRANSVDRKGMRTSIQTTVSNAYHLVRGAPQAEAGSMLQISLGIAQHQCLSSRQLVTDHRSLAWYRVPHKSRISAKNFSDDPSRARLIFQEARILVCHTLTVSGMIWNHHNHTKQVSDRHQIQRLSEPMRGPNPTVV